MLPPLFEALAKGSLNPKQLRASELNAGFFTEGVLLLTDPETVRHERINRLARLLFMLVNQRVILTAMATEPKLLDECKGGLNFFVYKDKADSLSKATAMVFIHPLWSERVMEDPWYELGGVVYIASHACDVYHNQIPPNRRLALGWEAEFLCYAQKNFRNFTANAYQRKLMESFPDGLASLPHDMVYPITEFQMGTTRAPGREDPIWTGKTWS